MRAFLYVAFCLAIASVPPHPALAITEAGLQTWRDRLLFRRSRCVAIPLAIWIALLCTALRPHCVQAATPAAAAAPVAWSIAKAEKAWTWVDSLPPVQRVAVITAATALVGARALVGSVAAVGLVTGWGGGRRACLQSRQP